jgi:hypothetical protein
MENRARTMLNMVPMANHVGLAGGYSISMTGRLTPIIKPIILDINLMG